MEEKNYKCPVDGQSWGGIAGEVPTVCPECGAEAEEVTADEEETVDADEEDEAETGEAQPVETAKYKITGLVDFSDEQGNIKGQLPIGSVHELPVVVGDKAVEEGRAELVSEE